jgi:protein-S-isoprenylcysteine O-methyltransferase Ste14
MKNLWLFIKNLLFTLLVPGFVAGWVPLKWFERRAQWPESWTWHHGAGGGLIALGVVTYIHCVWLFATRGHGTPAPFDPPRRLIWRGLYKWVRNPLYLGLLALVAGEALFLHSRHILVYLICLACVVHLVVLGYEEGALRMKFGAMYEDYKRAVPRWLPRKPRPLLQTVAPFDFRR